MQVNLLLPLLQMRHTLLHPLNWPVYGMYEPDGIAVLEEKGVPYLFTANEGDGRE